MRKSSIWTKRNKKSLPISRRTMQASHRLPKNARKNSFRSQKPLTIAIKPEIVEFLCYFFSNLRNFDA